MIDHAIDYAAGPRPPWVLREALARMFGPDHRVEFHMYFPSDNSTYFWIGPVGHGIDFMSSRSRLVVTENPGAGELYNDDHWHRWHVTLDWVGDAVVQWRRDDTVPDRGARLAAALLRAGGSIGS